MSIITPPALFAVGTILGLLIGRLVQFKNKEQITLLQLEKGRMQGVIETQQLNIEWLEDRLQHCWKQEHAHSERIVYDMSPAEQERRIKMAEATSELVDKINNGELTIEADTIIQKEDPPAPSWEVDLTHNHRPGDKA